MKVIKELLDVEIQSGFINWQKLEEKIHAALNAVGNKFESIREDGGKTKTMKFEDALTFRVMFNDTPRCYKLIQPRFTQGKLFCAGLKMGYYDLRGKPYFIDSKA